MFEVSNANSDMLAFFNSLGGKSELVDGFDVIKSFTTPEAESFSLFNGVGLRYLSSYGIIEVKGNDAMDFLHRISTNSMKELKKEDVKPTIFTTEKGRIIGVSTVLNFESYLLLVSSLKNQPKIMSWLNKYIVGDDVKISDAGFRFNVLEILGPQAESFLNYTIGEAVGDIRDNSFNVVGSDGALFFLVRIKSLSGRVKFWILADYENSKKFVTSLMNNKGPYDFNFIGEDAYNAYRIELGIPEEPNELNDFYNPLEANVNHLVDFKKGCYIGQEVIARLDTYDKVQRQLVGITFPEPIDEKEKFTLIDEKNTEVGTVTSIAYSPRIKKNIGMGYVKKSEIGDDKKIIAKNETKVMEVKLVELPFKK